ncbi:hypothetical protein SXIM_54340 [Streptomyces xiamenensis]|uniref:Uncharacterized protein n=1 Tax=Streptomyces xiamenensis TaxID=408015 RepID=A0A0F7G0U1_9ACTN|nr:hypothetical protein SXIM_54340 [Streptomyces xiamenensis]
MDAGGTEHSVSPGRIGPGVFLSPAHVLARADDVIPRRQGVADFRRPHSAGTP